MQVGTLEIGRYGGGRGRLLANSLSDMSAVALETRNFPRLSDESSETLAWPVFPSTRYGPCKTGRKRMRSKLTVVASRD